MSAEQEIEAMRQVIEEQKRRIARLERDCRQYYLIERVLLAAGHLRESTLETARNMVEDLPDGGQ